MEDKNTFTVINEEGKEVVCNVLFTFDSDETKKNYIEYTENTKDKQRNIQEYASIYDKEQEDNMELLPIETDKEWKVIETILESLQEEIRNTSSDNSNSSAN